MRFDDRYNSSISCLHSGRRRGIARQGHRKQAIPTRRDRIYRTRGRTARVDDIRLEETLLYFVRGTGVMANSEDFADDVIGSKNALEDA